MAVSVILQIAAAALALRLIRITGRYRAWIMMSAAVLLMAVRRMITLLHLIGSPEFRPDMQAELVALGISVLMVSSLLLIGPYFRSVMEKGEAIKESEEKYRKLLKNAHDAIFIADAKTGLIKEANSRCGELIGRPAGEIVGTHVLDFCPEEEKERYMTFYSNFLKTGGGETSEICVCRRDGKTIPVQISAATLEFGSGKYLFGVLRDMTERRKAEESINRLNRVLLALSMCNEAVIKAKDEKELYENVCRTIVGACKYPVAFVAMKGPGGEDACLIVSKAGDDENKLCPADHEAEGPGECRPPMHRAVQEGRPVILNDIEKEEPCEKWRSEAVGRKYASACFFPFSLYKKTTGVLAVYAKERDSFDEKEVRFLGDLTENLAHGVRAIGAHEEKQRLFDVVVQAKAEWEMTFDSAAEMIMLVDEDFRIARCNKSFAQYAGEDMVRVLGRWFYEFFIIGPKDVKHLRDLIGRGESIEKMEARAEKNRWFYLSLLPIAGNGREIKRTVVVATDITELKNAQRKLEESEEKLRARLDELERFYKMAVGRELRMKELKGEARELREKLSMLRQYESEGR